MTAPAEEPRMLRITVTLDAYAAGLGELERAAALAARLGAELEGMFVEDQELIRLAGLPFLREIRSTSLGVEALESRRMEQELRVMARRAERSLAEHAGRHGLSWTFRVWRGPIAQDLLSATLDADVLALARLGSLTAPRRLARPGVAVLFDGTAAGTRALATAGHLATGPDTPVTVLLPPGDPQRQEELGAQARTLLQATGDAARIVPLPADRATDLARTLGQSGSAVLVLGRDNRLLGTTSLRDLLEGLGCPLLVVR